MTSRTLTIGKLARAANVGVETVRYYQQRGLLPLPPAGNGYRQYPPEFIERIRFVKRAQELGFSLEEIAGLLRLNDGSDRESIREIATARLAQIETKLADLHRMAHALGHLVAACEHATLNQPCPIIDTLAHGAQPPKK